jgi:hypothetical protein
MLHESVVSFPSTKPCFTNLLAGKSIRARFSKNAGSGSGEVNVYSKNYDDACKFTNFGGGLSENSLGGDANNILVEKKQGAFLQKTFNTHGEIQKEKKNLATREHCSQDSQIQLLHNADTLIPGTIRRQEKYNSCAS